MYPIHVDDDGLVWALLDYVKAAAKACAKFVIKRPAPPVVSVKKNIPILWGTLSASAIYIYISKIEAEDWKSKQIWIHSDKKRYGFIEWS